MGAKPILDPEPTVYIHPILFIPYDWTIRGVLSAFDNCDKLFYWFCLSPEVTPATDC